ncbi:XRE family transcriptional regulator [Paenibacillus sp. 8b26]|uniref:XRE family transcriptional regulator n=1 Tax=Paenibacillus sp. 8b26 TaxID=3424133 RepID=UPI003D657167
MGQIYFKLSETLEMIGATRNKVAVESKTRPATILDLASGDTKTIKLETLVNILNAINEIAHSHGLEKTFGIEDIIQYIPKNIKNER